MTVLTLTPYRGDFPGGEYLVVERNHVAFFPLTADR